MTLENSIGIRSFFFVFAVKAQPQLASPKSLKVVRSNQQGIHFEIISSLTPSVRKRSAISSISFFF